MLIKLGVDISRLDRTLRKKLTSINNVFSQNGTEAIITSTYEGDHSLGSLHYANQAIDFRRLNIQSTVLERIVESLKKELGTDFDIILEETHIHIEFDPKV